MTENKHTSEELAQMQRLPLDAKIRMTKERIRTWYDSWIRYEIYNAKTGKTRFVTATEPPQLKDGEGIETATSGQVYVSFSGGKDSTVLKHIVDSMYSDVPAVFINTGLEYPEIQQFVRDIKRGKYDCFSSNVEMVRPEMRFDEVLKTYGYPVITKETAANIEYGRKAIERKDDEKIQRYLYGVRKNKNTGEAYQYMGLSKLALDVALNSDIPISNKCCKVMKKEPSKKYGKVNGRMSIQGTTTSESRLREFIWLKNGCNAFNAKEPISRPISFWTEQDVLQYIKENNVPYCSVYGDIVEDNGKLKTTGCDRTGCMFCMFGCHFEKEPNRFQRLKETHPIQYKFCIGGGEMVDGKWQPSKEGLGLGYVLDYIGVKYE